jgi:hypothetical protein
VLTCRILFFQQFTSVEPWGGVAEVQPKLPESFLGLHAFNLDRYKGFLGDFVNAHANEINNGFIFFQWLLQLEIPGPHIIGSQKSSYSFKLETNQFDMILGSDLRILRPRLVHPSCAGKRIRLLTFYELEFNPVLYDSRVVTHASDDSGYPHNVAGPSHELTSCHNTQT